MADYLGTLAQVDPTKLSFRIITRCCKFFCRAVTTSNTWDKLLKKSIWLDQVKVVIEEDRVQVVFEETAYYWRFAENGSVNQKAQHFVVVRLNKIKIRLKNHDTTNIRFMGRMSNLGKTRCVLF